MIPLGVIQQANNGVLKTIENTYNSTSTAKTNASSLTVSGVTIGVPSDDRLIVVSIASRHPGWDATISVKIGGVTATIAAQYGPGNTESGVIAYRLVPSGATTTIQITMSSSYVWYAPFSVYALKGLDSIVPYSTDKDFSDTRDPSYIHLNASGEVEGDFGISQAIEYYHPIAYESNSPSVLDNSLRVGNYETRFIHNVSSGTYQYMIYSTNDSNTIVGVAAYWR